ncbi:MAG TPA: DUF378 domain-containing protein [Candidatus Paceibacterota bacterium]|nr:DUF378 domain-containing protein [Candidatus Paceibacterota bacterium]
MSSKTLHIITFFLLVIGGVNWLLLVLNYELGALFLGGMNSTASIVLYVLVGLSALYQLVTHKKDCKTC